MPSNTAIEFDVGPGFQWLFVCSMGHPPAYDMQGQALARPPESWADFITCLFLADVALWRFSSTFMEGKFNPVANLVRRFGEECYFHQLCIDGWIKSFSATEKTEAGVALSKRLPQVLAWFGSERQSADDLLLEEGLRTESVWSARTRFIQDIAEKLSPHTDVSTDQLTDIAGEALPGDWGPLRRRRTDSEITASLWETVIPTSEAAQIARRPLAVSIKDNIDLFQTAKKDETEPVFAV